MNLLIILLTAAMLAWYFVEVLRFPMRYKILYRKPLNCTTCLSAWLAAGLYFVPESITHFLFVFIGAACVGAWLEK